MTHGPEWYAQRLLEARRTLQPIEASESSWRDLDLSMMSRIGDLFTAGIGANDSPFWKLGVVDSAAQDRMGVLGPVTAPLDPSLVMTEVDHTAVSIASMIEPKLEPEIGIFMKYGQRFMMPCVEIADSRFKAWDVPPGGVLADGGLQGRMIFGPPRQPRSEICVQVSLDGELIAHGEGAWDEVESRLSYLPASARPTMVATGSLTVPIAATPGCWSFDFGALGTLTIDML